MERAGLYIAHDFDFPFGPVDTSDMDYVVTVLHKLVELYNSDPD